jgi:hypothetical protein
MHILFPGRHHLLTQFQFQYLSHLENLGLSQESDGKGRPLGLREPVRSFIFAITSANQSHTRRNPLPLYLRSMMIVDFSNSLKTPCFIYAIDDKGQSEQFADYTLKRIHDRSHGRFDLSPRNTLVLCSNHAVMIQYEQLGFHILPAELSRRNPPAFSTSLPWELIECAAEGDGDFLQNPRFLEQAHEATHKIWRAYGMTDLAQRLFQDGRAGAEEDPAEPRDFNVHARRMDEIACQKFEATRPFIQSGRIGDIGCAVGSWIKFASADPDFHESDFYGVEVSRPLFNICEQRKTNQEFGNPFVFFSRKNDVAGPVFRPNSMNTIHTSSLTHEIKSYVSREAAGRRMEAQPGLDLNAAFEQEGLEQLQRFIRSRYQELASGGVWVNRDVVGPENGEEEIFLWLEDQDGYSGPEDRTLEELSTRARFRRFAQDFRRQEGYTCRCTWVDKPLGCIRLSLRDACEFLSKKDYTDNWLCEMHETYAFWSYSDWQQALTEAGFVLRPGSRVWCNPWIREHRIQPTARIYRIREGELEEIEFPETTVILVAEKR